MGVELDQHRGEERIYALFARGPMEEERVRRALRSAFEDARSRGAGIAGMARVPLPVEQASVWFRKP